LTKLEPFLSNNFCREEQKSAKRLRPKLASFSPPFWVVPTSLARRFKPFVLF
jgi:hypothetical protein